MKHKVLSWMAAFVLIAYGAALSYSLYTSPEGKGGGSIDLAARSVIFVVPVGWVLFFLLWTCLIDRCLNSILDFIVAVMILRSAVATVRALLFEAVTYDMVTLHPRATDPAIPMCLRITPLERGRSCGSLTTSHVLEKF